MAFYGGFGMPVVGFGMPVTVLTLPSPAVGMRLPYTRSRPVSGSGLALADLRPYQLWRGGKEKKASGPWSPEEVLGIKVLCAPGLAVQGRSARAPSPALPQN